MKKFLFFGFGAMLLAPSLSGCAAVGEKAASLSIIYAVAALLSLILLVGCCGVVKKRRGWFLLLFSSVFVVNAGYTLLSVSSGLEVALWANRLAYLGSVFLPQAMLMIILNVIDYPYKKWLPAALIGLSMAVFLVAASPGILPIYYSEVSFAVINGVSTLQKVYGPLHPLYLFYLLGYFAAMVTIIVRARIKNAIDTAAHAIVLIIAVMVNIGVWLIEQLTSIEFEILSISYIISELFLLGAHLMMRENLRLSTLIRQSETVCRPQEAAAPSVSTPIQQIEPERLELFTNGISHLTTTERLVFEAHTQRLTTKEIMSELSITENTLKYHNKNIYGKLGVASKKELLEIYKYLLSLQK